MNGHADGKARQIYLVLRDRIVSGALPYGDKLPPEPELAEAHGVARITVRRALAQLAAEGLVERRPSSGTRVIHRRAAPILTADIANVLATLAEMGRSTGLRLMSFSYETPPDAVAAALGLEAGERTQRSVRVRLVDGAPFSFLTTHVPERIGLTYSEAELATTPLLTLLDRSGVEVARATQTIAAALAAPEVARALDVDVGAPLIEMTRVVFDQSGQGVEHLHALYRPDRYAFCMDLVRTGARGTPHWSPVGRVIAGPHDHSGRTPKTNQKPARARPAATRSRRGAARCSTR
ncbi:HTH-type transcriptional repressor YvoA [Rhodoplanes serenus]|uniref:HTH-type transcriptional repressor YvoA n=1 Tax=Rhodoplanes serenus TaxID=200615 RepID=A0A3S4BHF0_9BRAD|nr:GntR family transcriptional regulator [Rhodoplanes serenus]VCU10030.1 HTH-type transcriptional repressor YvoA [Rhodoplanes serenus]